MEGTAHHPEGSIRLASAHCLQASARELERRHESPAVEPAEITPYVGSLLALPYAEIDELSPEFRREKLKAAIAEIVEGNPFYLEEVINTLIETQLLTRDD
jgi:hypothetical protein